MKVRIQEFFHGETGSVCYVAWHPETRDAVVIDPVLDFDLFSGRIMETFNESVIEFVIGSELTVHLILETCVHADHLSGAQFLLEHWPQARLCIGDSVIEAQRRLAALFNLPSFPMDGRSFHRLLKDGEWLHAGALPIEVLAMPGHSPAGSCFLIADTLFVGDALLMPDVGVGRCDFPGGGAESLYDSVQRKIFRLPDRTRIAVGRDESPPSGRAPKFFSTVEEQKSANIHLNAGVGRQDFVRLQRQRDQSLSPSKWLYPSLQINMAGGRLPPPELNGRSYLKMPLFF